MVSVGWKLCRCEVVLPLPAVFFRGLPGRLEHLVMLSFGHALFYKLRNLASPLVIFIFGRGIRHLESC